MKFSLLSLLCLTACFTVRVSQVDHKTTLEEQFIGEYEDLSDDLASDASVRAETTGMGARGDDPYARALQARRLQKFYADDLNDGRRRGCIGETNDGHVAPLDCREPSSQPVGPTMARLVKTENASREALVEYAISRDPNLKDSDRPMVWQALRRLVLSTAPKGTPVQNGNGAWITE